MDKPVVFADFHHEGLLNSLKLLFEKRLGGELYRPIGMDWFTDGYWAINNIQATAEQYLKPGSVPTDGTHPLNDDISRCITLKDFKESKVKFDIVIASIPQHIEPFKKLIALYQPQAKLIFQIGNAWNIPNNSVRNVMASAKCIPPIQINYIEYHQEFDLHIFRPRLSLTKKRIYSFINCLNVVSIYQKDWELFQELERLMPDWEFRSFGGQCRDGYATNDTEVAEAMNEATFIFHCKSEGDGYGHIIHQAAAMGKPLITRASDYKNKLAEPLISDATSIIIDGRSPEEIVEMIRRDFIDRVDYMGRKIHSAFKKNVDFDKEEQQIREFLNHLQ